MIKSLFYFFCFLTSFVKIEAKPCYTCIQGGGGSILGGYGGGYSSTYGSYGGYSSFHSGYSGGSPMMGNYLQGGGDIGGVDLLGAALILGTGAANGIHQQMSGSIWDGSNAYQHGFRNINGFQHVGGLRHGSGFRHGGGYRHAGGFQHGGGFAQQGFQQGFQEGGGFRQGGGSQHSEENGNSGSDIEGGKNSNEDKKSNIYNIGNGRENHNTVNIYLNKG